VITERCRHKARRSRRAPAAGPLQIGYRLRCRFGFARRRDLAQRGAQFVLGLSKIMLCLDALAQDLAGMNGGNFLAAGASFNDNP
jgi:hypothetical protein